MLTKAEKAAARSATFFQGWGQWGIRNKAGTIHR